MIRSHVRGSISLLSICFVSMALWAAAPGAVQPAAAQAPTPNAPTIAVAGEGEVQVTPDRAAVPIEIESDAPTSSAAGASNAKLTRAVVDALKRAGAGSADIATQGYSVQPQWQYSQSGPPKRSGYRASMQLQLTVSDLQRLGPWIDAALSAGASGVGNVQYDSSRLQAARQQALTLAVQHARSDAGTLAAASGGKLGDLVELSTQQPGIQPGVLQEAVVTAARREVGTTFQGTQLQIHAVVLARWAFVAQP